MQRVLRVWAVSLIMALLLNSLSFAQQSGGTLKFITRERPLTEVLDTEKLDATQKPVVFSSDNRHAAYTARRGDKSYVVIDGVAVSAPYDKLGLDTIVFNAKSSAGKKFHIAYVGVRAGKLMYVVDGVEGKGYDSIEKGSFVFSADGSHYAYLAKQGQRWLGVIDGVEVGSQYEDIAPGFRFSPDGKHVAYMAVNHRKWFVILDGKEGEKYDGVSPDSLLFSPDGSRIAYAALRNGKSLVVVNGVEGKEYNGLSPGNLCFSPDSQHVAYATKKGDKWVVVRDGVEGKEYKDGFTANSFCFSPDSRRFGYVAARGGKQFAVIDGVEGKEYPFVVNITFSADSRRVAYGTMHSNKAPHRMSVVVDEVEGKIYDAVNPFSIRFSPNSRRIAYIAYGVFTEAKKEGMVVVDGVEGKKFPGLASPVFSFDSKRIAYMTWHNAHAVSVVVDGTEGKQYEGFGPDSELLFETDKKLSYIALYGGQFVRVEMEIVEE
jgi:hypothetical protein